MRNYVSFFSLTGIRNFKHYILWFFKLQRGGPSQFFQWMGETFVPGVYAGSWYNGDDERLQEYIGNKRSLLVGMPRLRQLRVKEGKQICFSSVQNARVF